MVNLGDAEHRCHAGVELAQRAEQHGDVSVLRPVGARELAQDEYVFSLTTKVNRFLEAEMECQRRFHLSESNLAGADRPNENRFDDRRWPVSTEPPQYQGQLFTEALPQSLIESVGDLPKPT